MWEVAEFGEVLAGLAVWMKDRPTGDSLGSDMETVMKLVCMVRGGLGSCCLWSRVPRCIRSFSLRSFLGR